MLKEEKEHQAEHHKLFLLPLVSEDPYFNGTSLQDMRDAEISHLLQTINVSDENIVSKYNKKKNALLSKIKSSSSEEEEQEPKEQEGEKKKEEEGKKEDSKQKKITVTRSSSSSSKKKKNSSSSSKPEPTTTTIPTSTLSPEEAVNPRFARVARLKEWAVRVLDQNAPASASSVSAAKKAIKQAKPLFLVEDLSPQFVKLMRALQMIDSSSSSSSSSPKVERGILLQLAKEIPQREFWLRSSLNHHTLLEAAIVATSSADFSSDILDEIVDILVERGSPILNLPSAATGRRGASGSSSSALHMLAARGDFQSISRILKIARKENRLRASEAEFYGKEISATAQQIELDTVDGFAASPVSILFGHRVALHATDETPVNLAIEHGNLLKMMQSDLVRELLNQSNHHETLLARAAVASLHLRASALGVVSSSIEDFVEMISVQYKSCELVGEAEVKKKIREEKKKQQEENRKKNIDEDDEEEEEEEDEEDEEGKKKKIKSVSGAFADIIKKKNLALEPLRYVESSGLKTFSPAGYPISRLAFDHGGTNKNSNNNSPPPSSSAASAASSSSSSPAAASAKHHPVATVKSTQARKLVELIPEEILLMVDEAGRTVLHWAVSTGAVELTEALLQRVPQLASVPSVPNKSAKRNELLFEALRCVSIRNGYANYSHASSRVHFGNYSAADAYWSKGSVPNGKLPIEFAIEKSNAGIADTLASFLLQEHLKANKENNLWINNNNNNNNNKSQKEAADYHDLDLIDCLLANAISKNLKESKKILFSFFQSSSSSSSSATSAASASSGAKEEVEELSNNNKTTILPRRSIQTAISRNDREFLLECSKTPCSSSSSSSSSILSQVLLQVPVRYTTQAKSGGTGILGQYNLSKKHIANAKDQLKKQEENAAKHDAEFIASSFTFVTPITLAIQSRNFSMLKFLIEDCGLEPHGQVFADQVHDKKFELETSGKSRNQLEAGGEKNNKTVSDEEDEEHEEGTDAEIKRGLSRSDNRRFFSPLHIIRAIQEGQVLFPVASSSRLTTISNESMQKEITTAFEILKYLIEKHESSSAVTENNNNCSLRTWPRALRRLLLQRFLYGQLPAAASATTFVVDALGFANDKTRIQVSDQNQYSWRGGENLLIHLSSLPVPGGFNEWKAVPPGLFADAFLAVAPDNSKFWEEENEDHNEFDEDEEDEEVEEEEEEDDDDYDTRARVDDEVEPGVKFDLIGKESKIFRSNAPKQDQHILAFYHKRSRLACSLLLLSNDLPELSHVHDAPHKKDCHMDSLDQSRSFTSLGCKSDVIRSRCLLASFLLQEHFDSLYVGTKFKNAARWNIYNICAQVTTSLIGKFGNDFASALPSSSSSSSVTPFHQCLKILEEKQNKKNSSSASPSAAASSSSSCSSSSSSWMIDETTFPVVKDTYRRSENPLTATLSSPEEAVLFLKLFAPQLRHFIVKFGQNNSKRQIPVFFRPILEFCYDSRVASALDEYLLAPDLSDVVAFQAELQRRKDEEKALKGKKKKNEKKKKNAVGDIPNYSPPKKEEDLARDKAKLVLTDFWSNDASQEPKEYEFEGFDFEKDPKEFVNLESFKRKSRKRSIATNRACVLGILDFCRSSGSIVDASGKRQTYEETFEKFFPRSQRSDQKLYENKQKKEEEEEKKRKEEKEKHKKKSKRQSDDDDAKEAERDIRHELSLLSAATSASDFENKSSSHFLLQDKSNHNNICCAIFVSEKLKNKILNSSSSAGDEDSNNVAEHELSFSQNKLFADFRYILRFGSSSSSSTSQNHFVDMRFIKDLESFFTEKVHEEVKNAAIHSRRFWNIFECCLLEIASSARCRHFDNNQEEGEKKKSKKKMPIVFEFLIDKLFNLLPSHSSSAAARLFCLIFRAMVSCELHSVLEPLSQKRVELESKFPAGDFSKQCEDLVTTFETNLLFDTLKNKPYPSTAEHNNNNNDQNKEQNEDEDEEDEEYDDEEEEEEEEDDNDSRETRGPHGFTPISFGGLRPLVQRGGISSFFAAKQLVAGISGLDHVFLPSDSTLKQVIFHFVKEYEKELLLSQDSKTTTTTTTTFSCSKVKFSWPYMSSSQKLKFVEIMLSLQKKEKETKNSVQLVDTKLFEKAPGQQEQQIDVKSFQQFGLHLLRCFIFPLSTSQLQSELVVLFALFDLVLLNNNQQAEEEEEEEEEEELKNEIVTSMSSGFKPGSSPLEQLLQLAMARNTESATFQKRVADFVKSCEENLKKANIQVSSKLVEEKQKEEQDLHRIVLTN